MSLVSVLEIGLEVALAYVLVSLTFLVLITFGSGRKKQYAKAAGSEMSGITYAFFQGMMPWEKESVAKHVPTFVGGLLYHAGIFAAAVYTVVVRLHWSLSPVMVLSIRLIMIAGLAAGVGLLIKRIRMPKMRLISVPDDYISNALVDLFLVAGIAATMKQSLGPVLLGAVIVLLLYVPIGKIRHCVFFFCTRIIFGRLFGRRGVLPHPSRESQAGS